MGEAKIVLQAMLRLCLLLLLSSSLVFTKWYNFGEEPGPEPESEDEDYPDRNIRNRVMAKRNRPQARFSIPPDAGLPSLSDITGCFSGSSKVETQHGLIQLRDLKLNDSVLTHTPGVGTHFTRFLGWLDRSSFSATLMLKISTSSYSSLTLPPSHVVFRLSDKGDLESVYANQLVEGDRLVRLKSRHKGVESDE